jgi:hypothetical protein
MTLALLALVVFFFFSPPNSDFDPPTYDLSPS